MSSKIAENHRIYGCIYLVCTKDYNVLMVYFPINDIDYWTLHNWNNESSIQTYLIIIKNKSHFEYQFVRMVLRGYFWKKLCFQCHSIIVHSLYLSVEEFAAFIDLLKIILTYNLIINQTWTPNESLYSFWTGSYWNLLNTLFPFFLFRLSY